MRIFKTIGLVILYIIGIILFATILALGTIFTYFPLQLLIYGRGDYLLFVSGNANMIPVYMIMGLIIYFAIKLKQKLFKRKDELIEPLEEEEPLDTEVLSKKEKTILDLLNKLMAFDGIAAKVFKIIKICYIPALIIAIYCGLTSYTILYKENIKLGSPVKPAGTIYKYTDIKSIDVRIHKYKRNSYEPRYTITLNDEKTVNLFGGSMHEEGGKSFEYILMDLDETLKAKGVSKTVDKTNFENYAKGLDKSFISRIEKLFDNK